MWASPSIVWAARAGADPRGSRGRDRRDRAVPARHRTRAGAGGEAVRLGAGRPPRGRRPRPRRPLLVLAAYCARLDADDPLGNLEIGGRPAPEAPAGGVTVDVRAPPLTPHALFALQGVALRADRVPMILGTDAAGID